MRGHDLTRRGFLLGAGAIAAGAPVTAGAAAARGEVRGSPPPVILLGTQPDGLPVRQYAWTETLRTDRFGNPLPPRYDRLLFFDVRGPVTSGHARLLEAALRTLERTFAWGPSGLLFTAAWSHSYFTGVVHGSSPVPRATALSAFESPAIDDYHLCLHLACDEESRLAAVESALLHGVPLPGAHGQLQLTDALIWRETRTGFTGAGLPAAHQRVGGIPPGHPVPHSAPLFMGFRSSLRRNQASEDAISVPTGPFAHGATMAVSYIRLRLDGWYRQLTERERVARMYSPETTPEDVARITTDAPSEPGEIGQAISRYGAVGHAQTVARARRHGRPLLLRRDFSTVDGGQAGLHFVSLQRSIADFVATRTAMNAVSAQVANPSITNTANNGINEFIFVLKRGNYMIPPRASRSFPLLAGRETQLG